MFRPLSARVSLSACLCAAALMALSCSGPVVTAVGDADDLVIIAAGGGSESVALLLELAEAEVPWLLGEPVFEPVVTTPGQSGDLKNIRHIIVLGTWDDRELSRLARTAAPSLERGDPPRLTLVEDVWANRQVVGVVLGNSEAELEDFLRRQGAALVRSMEAAAVKRLSDSLRETATEAGMAQAMRDRFGWSIAPPSGYDFYTTSSDEGFVFFRRTRPDRSVFVYWEEGGAGSVTEESATGRRNELASLYYDGDAIESRRPFLSEEVDFLGRRAIRLSGWWANTELVGGGPFRSYCFYEPEQGRVYMIDVSLFAPSFDKTSLMRNLDAIAHTFESGTGSGS
jgi:hypothetical protein